MSKSQLAILFLLLGGLFPVSAHGQVGNVFTNVSAASGGASTAMPLNASGAQAWNPAGISDLRTTELDLNTRVAFPEITVNASLPIPAMPGGVAGTLLAGEIESGNKVNTTPSFGFVKKLKKSPWTFGMLGSTTLGSGVSFPKSDNPITTNREIKVSGDLIYMAHSVAYRINKHWSVGLQPSLTIISLKASPFSRVKPDDANGDGIPTFPSTNRAWATGFGIQGGVYYHNKNIHLGAALKSPQWFTPFHFESKDELGHPRHFSTTVDSPLTLSLGAGYSGIPRLKLSSDFRYVNYENSGLGQSGLTEEGVLKGPGWRNIWAFVESANLQITKNCNLSLTYSYNQSPVRSQLAVFSIASPAIIQHHMNVALGYRVRSNMVLAVAYQHGFESSRTGPVQTPRGPLPGSFVKVTSGWNTVVASLIYFFK